MKRSIVIFLFSLCLSAPVQAQEFNAGIVQGLWYDRDVFFVADTVRVYVAIRNNTGADLTGTVEFFDGDTRIARKSVSALDGRIIESWADWKPTYGEHSLRATLSRTEIHQIGTGTAPVTLTSALAQDTVFVDYDTDKDDIGDETDLDDDNDGVSDEDETEAGTDPRDANDTPKKPDATEPVNTNTGEDEAGAVEDSTESSTAPAGLEQYLTPSRADSALTYITSIVRDSKRALDTYRAARTESHNRNSETTNNTQIPTLATSSTSTIETPPSDKTPYSSFGEITRTKADTGPGLLATISTFFTSLVGSLYTLILFLLSQYLAHPVVVQLTLLFLILLVIFKTAQRLGSRPR